MIKEESAGQQPTNQPNSSTFQQPKTGKCVDRPGGQLVKEKFTGSSAVADPGRRAFLGTGIGVALQSIVIGWTGDAIAKEQTSLLSGETTSTALAALPSSILKKFEC